MPERTNPTDPKTPSPSLESGPKPPLLIRRNIFSHLWYVAWSLLATGVITTVMLVVR